MAPDSTETLGASEYPLDFERWTAAGIIARLAASVALLRPLQSLLYEVSALGLRVFAAAAGVLAAVAISASWLPARRASLLDPVLALPHE